MFVFYRNLPKEHIDFKITFLCRCLEFMMYLSHLVFHLAKNHTVDLLDGYNFSVL